MRWQKIWLAGSILGVFVGWAAPLAAQADRVRVGAWNVEWLGMPENRKGEGQNRAQKPQDLADYIAACRVDIIALEEICDDDGEDEKHSNSILSRTVTLLNKSPQVKWRYKLFPKREADDTEQLTGILWNTKRLEIVGEPFRIPLDDTHSEYTLWERHPHAVKFTCGDGKSDFVLVPIHMKSNRQGEIVGAKQRAVEAERLVKALALVRDHFSDRDVILLGDFNMKSRDEAASYSLSGADFADLNYEDETTMWMGDAPFDRVLVPGEQPEFEQSEFWIMRPEYLDNGEFRRLLSDHFMVKTSIKVLADDD